MTVKELIAELQKMVEMGYENKIVTVDEMECGEEVKEVMFFENEVILSF